MTFQNKYKEAHVWIWLPNETEPIVAGFLTEIGKQLVFNYDTSYLNRENAIAIYDPELPLKRNITSFERNFKAFSATLLARKPFERKINYLRH